MRLETRTWFVLSVLCFIGAVYFWLRGNEYERRKRQNHPQPTATNKASATAPFQLLSQLPPPAAGGGSVGPASATSSASNGKATTNAFPFRLTNTSKPLRELSKSNGAILMRNAFIDTTANATLAIPAALQAAGDPGAYIVQARGPIQSSFREGLRASGASIVSYIPNNAYLVQASAAAAQQLSSLPDTQAVLPYEPYYKLDSKLLAAAVKQEPLAPTDRLRVTAFPGQQQVVQDALINLGGEVLSDQRTPFGPQLLVRPAADTLTSIARLASVQTVELDRPRHLLNDMTRVQLGISADEITLTNYLGLTGTNVLVNLADSGVDDTHPDLKGRVLGDTARILKDVVAHGTHVAGIIAGDGSQSSTVSAPPSGSDTNANFRGMAPAARLFALPFQAYPEVSLSLNDTYLQETAALTNTTLSLRPNGPMISNNSWGYTGANDYDSEAALYDAAVRDAAPEVAGEQAMIFVFAAGNSGEGTDDGTGGQPNSIPSPASAKNVIAVGAIEHPRGITNYVTTTNLDGSLSSNAMFFAMTDSADQVASFSSRGNVGIGTEGDFGRFKPDLVAPGTFIVSTRSKDFHLEDDLDTNSPQYQILKEANEPLAPYYRYDSGTSQAAPVISGMLALMQEFFEQMLPTNLRRTNSPAMMKALLINGARSIGPLYDLEVQNSINYQGWGLPNITNSVPAMMLAQPEKSWPLQMIDQSATNALATGQSKSWTINLSTNAQDIPFRVTLVWTDPPGNPNAAIKLVNDLDLVVSNTVSGEVYYGNNITTGSDYTQPTLPDQAPNVDNVNNVENVFIQNPGSSNLVVTVRARRVNVMANPHYAEVTGNLNDVVQDYALVLSTDDTTLTNAFTMTPVSPAPALVPPPVRFLTNGVPLLNERAGANPSLWAVPQGLSNQWNFYVFTNLFVTNDISTMTNGTNVAFVTYLPPNVGRPRNSEADIDLYVSKDPGLLTLNASAVDGAWKSLTRLGTESIVFTNAALGDVYYIGVKSEDRQSGEYGLIALSTDQPFSQNKNGNQVLNGMPVPQPIPDGSPNLPGRATIMAIGVQPMTVKRAVVTTTMTHQDFGDLSVSLAHNQNSVVLLNHSLNNFNGTNVVFTFDDQSFGASPGVRHSDGPGSLTTFGGAPGNGVWMLNAIDNAPGYTGSVQNVTITLTPFDKQDLGAAGAGGISGTVQPHDAECFFVDVPPEATNLIVRLSQLTGPLEMLIQHGAIPTTNDFRIDQTFTPPGGDVSIGENDQPPIEAGIYFICLFNPTDSAVDFHVATEFAFGVGLDYQRTLVSTNVVPIIDNGVIDSSVYVPVDKEVADVQVAVRIDHPRSSDLVLHLISPQGTRVLLAENRGGLDSQGYGSGIGTNMTYTIFTENTNQMTNLAPVKFSLPPWPSQDTSTNPPTYSESFELAKPGTYNSTQALSGWSISQGQVNVYTDGNPLNVTAQNGTNFVELDSSAGPASMTASFPTVPSKDYVLKLYYQRNPATPLGTPQQFQVSLGSSTNTPAAVFTLDALYNAWQSTNIAFTAQGNSTEVTLSSTAPLGPLLDNITVNDAVPATNVYVLPEESLNLFQGERALGNWTLEVLDNRAGPPGTDSGNLLDWQLQLKYGNPADRAILLTNGIPYSGLVLTNSTNFFAVDVCDSAKVAFITLTGPTNSLNLLVDRTGLPTGDPIKDDFAPIPNDFIFDPTGTNGIASLTLTSDPHQPAPLIPGQRLYFAVHNLDPDPFDTNALAMTTNQFTIRVTYDPDTCSSNRQIIRLQDDVRYTNMVAPAAALIDYYVFNVTPGAVRAEFEVTPRNGDVGLLVHHGLPLPTLTNSDYRIDQPGITNELLVLTNGSAPVSLLPGDWYLGVYNNSTNPVVYDVRAHEVLDTNLNLIFLTNAVPLDFTIGAGAKATNYFIFKILEPHPGVKFELFNLNAPADLLLGLNSLPNYTNNFMSNSAGPASPAVIDLKTNATLPDITGDWVMSVISKATTNLIFTIRATLADTTTNQPPGTNRVFDPNITINGTNICFSFDTTVGLQYELQGKDSIVDTNWTVFYGPFVATETTFNLCTNLTTLPYHFFQVVELGSTNPPPTAGTVVDSSVTRTNGGFLITWASLIGTNYFVQGRTNITDPTWNNVSPQITATSTLSSYLVPTNSPYHFFQVIQAAGSTNQPPPTTNGVAVPSQLAFLGKTNILISWTALIGTNYVVEGKTSIVASAWDNLSGTITATNTTMTFKVKVSTGYQFFQVIQTGGGGTNTPPSGTNQPVSNLSLGQSTNRFLLTWPSLIGTNYLVQSKGTIVDPAWTNLSPVITATSTLTSYLLPTNHLSLFVQVVIVGGTNSTPPVSTNGVTLNVSPALKAGRLQFSWDAVAGTKYQVQYTTNLVPVVHWITVTNITATVSPVTFTEATGVTNGPMRFYRVVKP